MATFSPKSVAALRVGNHHYESLGPIGQPFGYQQLLANDTQHQRPVVIKTLAIEENTPTGDVCCFEREIHLLKTLRHPTIPRYIDSFQGDVAAGKGLVLVQSHLGGKTLEEQIAQGRSFSESEIRAIAKQLLQGLVYLHSKELVHRDIKPSNIVVAATAAELGQATWLNLGAVQYIQAQRSDALVGTYGYMPPEQIGGQATFASDLYSLGATLVYLIVGEHLKDLPHRGAQVQFACSTARVGANFQQWINWLIEPGVNNRPASAQQALTALNRLPLAMLKRRLIKPERAKTTPVPIKNSVGTQRHLSRQPFFTKIRAEKRRTSSELLTIPAIGLRSSVFKAAIAPLGIGFMLLAVALYLMSLLQFSAGLFSSLEGWATLAAAALAGVSGVYSLRFWRHGLYRLRVCLLRQIQIQLEEDVLLISYKYWLRPPIYIVNTKRECIYNISALPDGSALRILTHRNRTHASCACYKLTVDDGALSHRDIRWLASLLNEWCSRDL